MSRQQRKEAAAAARDLLNVDAARVRKSAAAPMRKAAAAPMRKAAAAPLSKPTTARVTEQRSSGCDAATPQRSFTDNSIFFLNGSGGDFFSSPVQGSEPWNQGAPDPAMWGSNATPPGASPISSSHRCHKILFLVVNLLSMHHSGLHGPRKKFNLKKYFRLLFQQRTITHMLVLTAVKRHQGLRRESIGVKKKMSGW